MIKWYNKLISNSNEASSRRFIAVWTLPFYWGAIFEGLIIAYVVKDFRFFIASLIAACLPIFLAFFALTWEHVKNILDTKAFKKGESFELTQDQLRDP